MSEPHDAVHSSRHADHPSPWVMRFLARMPSGARVLDLACGSGRHVAPCIAAGLLVTAVDRDTAALRSRFREVPADRLRIMDIDLENGRPFPFASDTFDGVIVTNYLWRPILSAIVAAVSPAGMLVYETFRIGNERYGRPRNPEFLLKPGELLAAVRDRLHVIACEEARLAAPDRLVQRICAVGDAHPWVEDPPPA